MRRTALGFILTIAVGVGLGAFSAVVVARDSDARPCADADVSPGLQDFLELHSEQLRDLPAAYTDFLVGTVSENGGNVRYDFDPPLTSLPNVDLHLAALAECAAGGRASPDDPTIVVAEVKLVGCDSAAENQWFQVALEARREFLVNRPVGYSTFLESTVTENGRTYRYEYDPPATSLDNIDLHLAALAECAAGGRASPGGPTIVEREVEPLGCESAADNQQLRDLFEFAREEIVSGAANETSPEMAGNSLDESDQALSLQFIDGELARLAACAPES